MLPFSRLEAQVATIDSPDGKLKLEVYLEEGQPQYTLEYEGKTILEKSPLGVITNEGDFSTNLSYVGHETDQVESSYTLETIKKSSVDYQANKLIASFADQRERGLNRVFQVSNNDVAFRYELPQWGERRACVVEREVTGLNSRIHYFPLTAMGAMGALPHLTQLRKRLYHRRTGGRPTTAIWGMFRAFSV